MMLFLVLRRVLITFGFGALLVVRASAAEAEPKLVVVISIDQFRADYLERFRPHFGSEGFNRFLEQGAYYTNCNYRHSHTKTACGHSVMLTGVHANVHSIIGNEWIDRNTFESRSCVGDPSVQLLGLTAKDRKVVIPGTEDMLIGRSPVNLTATTVGDLLKTAHTGSKVIGISNKDRSAILMSGKRADAAYFMERGRMVSSTYYFQAIPAWVEAWNDSGKVDSYFGKTWERALPEAAYAIQGPDAAPGEDIKTAQLGNTLPKKITGGDKAPGLGFYDAVRRTPFSNEYLVDFTEAAIENEKLGQRGVTDLLCVSFSGNDYIGHLYGPDSHEIMDNVVRMDSVLADFFKYLDAHIGLKNCTLVLTADHGVAPMPERMKVDHPETPAGRSYGALMLETAQTAMNTAFGPLADGSRWGVRDDTSFIFYPTALAEKKIDLVAAQNVVRDAWAKVSLVQAVYTRAQLEKGDVTDELGRMALRSFNRERSGDLYFQSKRYFFNTSVGSTHGTPYDYDTHVPLLWYGVGVKAGVRVEKVGVDDLAPTLANLLGLPTLTQSEGRVLF